MGYNAAPLERLIEQFAKLPGIGRKGATRLAYQVLSMDKEEALDFARAIEEAHTKIHRCRAGPQRDLCGGKPAGRDGV